MKLGRKMLAAAVGIAIVLTSGSALVSAADSKKSETKSTDTVQQSSSGSGVQGYAADAPLQIGTVVQLNADKKSSKVSPATQKELGRMFGVVVDPNRLSISINTGLPNETQVAVTGTYDTLVSTQGGAIKSGDYVTLSAINGVAMKADASQKTVFGRAAASFDGKNDALSSTELSDSSGKKTPVSIGIVPVAIDIRKNPNEKSTKTNVPKFLERIGLAVAEKPVGPLRIYLSIAITGISIIAALIILYSGVRSSIFSIGRNPLSKKSILRGLLEVILTSIIILIIGLFAVYLLLKL